MSDKIFDLEQSIMNCWNVVEDIKLLSEAIHDRPQPLTEDELSNLLIGLESLYQLKFDKMWGLFEEVCKEYLALKAKEHYDSYDLKDKDNALSSESTA